MKPVLLIDFGSTYTKLTAVDVEDERILACAQAFTTVRTDISEGLNNALLLIKQQTGEIEFEQCFACSSAAGGLKMVTSGLVPELTSQAATLACLGAGAKNLKTFSFELTKSDIDEISLLSPDIFLLTGGTDGGNGECILHNAKMLALLKPSFPIIIAGNRSVADECASILKEFEVYICPNVMPKFNQLNVEPTQKQIRDIFLNKIVSAKGLSKVTSLLSDIIMPTPSAVLKAMELLALGCEGERGIGELLGIDVGGATTDIYSVADGMPANASTVFKGLPEPKSKRTVEGDIGMRYSICGIVDVAGISKICDLSSLSEDEASALISKLASSPETVPDNDKLKALDYALACCAVDEATKRHAGTISETFTLMGKTFIQEGKNLTKVKNIVVTGGSLIHTQKTKQIADNALYSCSAPQSLRPQKADVFVDRKYILAAMGLLSTKYPAVSLRIMKKELEYHGYSE